MCYCVRACVRLSEGTRAGERDSMRVFDVVYFSSFLKTSPNSNKQPGRVIEAIALSCTLSLSVNAKIS